MRVIGVTGGIGSGKSTVSSFLKELGAKIIDADSIARQIVEKGKGALEEITGSFGAGILDVNGELDRNKLAGIVFADTEKLKVLNEITHKYIIEMIIFYIKEADKQGMENVVIDAAIPFEQGFLDISDEIWVVTADNEIRLDRIMKRNGLSREEALSRIEAQMKQEDYIRLADRVLSNNGNIIELRSKVKDLFLLKK